MKRRLRETANLHKQTIQSQCGKYQALKQFSNDLTTLTVNTSNQNENFNRGLGISTTRMTLTSSLKRSELFRKIVNHSMTSHYHTDTKKQQTNKSPQQQESVLENKDSRKSINLTIKNIQVSKGRGFQSFLQNKRKSNEKMSLIQYKRSKILKSICIDSPVITKNKTNDLSLNLQGKGIKKLKGSQYLPQNSKEMSPLNTFHQWSTSQNENNVNRSIKMRSIQTEWQKSKQIHVNTYVKYVLAEDEGYCLFDKLLNPISAKRPATNHKKLFYSDIHKEFRKSKQMQREEPVKPVAAGIDGWMVNSEDQWELSNSQNVAK